MHEYTCTKCNTIIYRRIKRKSECEYICQNCREGGKRLQLTQPIPKGILKKCDRCQHEFMSEFGRHYCPSCMELLKHQLGEDR